MPLAPRQTRFLITFALLLTAFYAIVTLDAVDEHVVVPFTRGLTAVSGALLNAIGQHVTVSGTVISSPQFAVDVRGGCNGLEAVVFVAAAMLSFAAPWRKRLAGALAAAVILESINVIRVASLYLIGLYHRSLFETFHLAIWQTVMFAIAVLLFVTWVSRFATPNAATRA
jgi:exosortase H (IPTLxxWG-CTERM-specific)